MQIKYTNDVTPDECKTEPSKYGNANKKLNAFF